MSIDSNWAEKRALAVESYGLSSGCSILDEATAKLQAKNESRADFINVIFYHLEACLLCANSVY